MPFFQRDKEGVEVYSKANENGWKAEVIQLYANPSGSIFSSSEKSENFRINIYQPRSNTAKASFIYKNLLRNDSNTVIITWENQSFKLLVEDELKLKFDNSALGRFEFYEPQYH